MGSMDAGALRRFVCEFVEIIPCRVVVRRINYFLGEEIFGHIDCDSLMVHDSGAF
jgi:hypothetical protein